MEGSQFLKFGATLFDVATYLLFAAYLVYALHTLLFQSRRFGPLATVLLGGSWLALTGALSMRALFYADQHGGFLFPATNMYEALSYFVWLVLLLYLFTEYKLKTRTFGLLALIIPAVALGYAGQTMSADPRELFPSLKSYWLVFHISAMFISYSLFFMAFIFGLLYVLRAWRTRGLGWLDSRFDLSYLDAMSSRFIRIGVPVLSLGVGLGAVWANAAWGRPWGWDPKETWALITWFIYIIYLHFRSYSWFNAYRAALTSLIGFVVVVVTFIGVNLIVDKFGKSSLHAYTEGGAAAAAKYAGLTASEWTLLSLLLLLFVPIVMLFLPIPVDALAHKRAESDPERAVKADRLPPPRKIGGGSAGDPRIGEVSQPQRSAGLSDDDA